MIDEQKKQVIYISALDVFGTDAQIDKAIEECAELILALQHHKSGRSANVVTEIADVLITVGQMRLLFGEKAVDAEIEEKLDRLENRIVGEMERNNR